MSKINLNDVWTVNVLNKIKNAPETNGATFSEGEIQVMLEWLEKEAHIPMLGNMDFKYPVPVYDEYAVRNGVEVSYGDRVYANIVLSDKGFKIFFGNSLDGIYFPFNYETKIIVPVGFDKTQHSGWEVVKTAQCGCLEDVKNVLKEKNIPYVEDVVFSFAKLVEEISTRNNVSIKKVVEDIFDKRSLHLDYEMGYANSLYGMNYISLLEFYLKY